MHVGVRVAVPSSTARRTGADRPGGRPCSTQPRSSTPCCGATPTARRATIGSRSSRCSTRRCSPTRPASRACGASCGPRSSRPTRIDVVMAFIRRSGIAPLLDALRRHCERRPAAAGADDDLHRLDRAAALDQLVDLGAEVRVSYDLSTTRLHAKAWVFHRRSGLLDRLRRLVEPHPLGAGHRPGVERPGLGRPQPRRDRQVRRRVRQLLGERRLRPVRPRRSSTTSSARAGRTDSGPHVILSPIELRPCPFQERLLELIELSPAAGPPPQPARRRHRHRQDRDGRRSTTRSLREQLAASRLLFIAHREEILDQSLATFRYALRDAVVRREVGRRRTTARGSSTSSPRSRASTPAASTTSPPDHFDVVIVDEFHHAAAASYERVLDHLAPGRAARPDRHARAQRRPADPALVRRSHRRRAAPVGRDRPAAPRAVPVLRHPRRPRPDATSRGGAAGATTSRRSATAYTSSDAWARLVVQQVAEHADAGDDARASGSA